MAEWADCAPSGAVVEPEILDNSLVSSEVKSTALGRSATAFMANNSYLAGFKDKTSGFLQTFIELVENSMDANARHISVKISPHNIIQHMTLKGDGNIPGAGKPYGGKVADSIVWSMTVEDDGAGMQESDVHHLLSSVFQSSKSVSYESFTGSFASMFNAKSQRGRYGVGLKGVVFHAQAELRNLAATLPVDSPAYAAVCDASMMPLWIATSQSSTEMTSVYRVGASHDKDSVRVEQQSSIQKTAVESSGTIISIPIVGGLEAAFPSIAAYVERLSLLNATSKVTVWVDHQQYIGGMLGNLSVANIPVVETRCDTTDDTIKDLPLVDRIVQLTGFPAELVVAPPAHISPALTVELALIVSPTESHECDKVREWQDEDNNAGSAMPPEHSGAATAANVPDALGYILRYVNGCPLVGGETECGVMRLLLEEFNWNTFGYLPSSTVTNRREKTGALARVLQHPATPSDWDLSAIDLPASFRLRSALLDITEMPFSRLHVIVNFRTASETSIRFAGLTKNSILGDRALSAALLEQMSASMLLARQRFPAWFASTAAKQLAIGKEVHAASLACSVQKIVDTCLSSGDPCAADLLASLLADCDGVTATSDAHALPRAVYDNLVKMMDVAWYLHASADGLQMEAEEFKLINDEE